jgi:hypothetical protein
MSVGTKNRLNQIGITCKAHLREAHRDQLGLVEEFIAEIEGGGKQPDPSRWSQFTDLKRDDKEMLQRADEAFEKWLRGEVG